MRAVLAISLATVAVGYSNWENFGEAVDAAVLSKPAVTDDLIDAISSEDGATWVAGRNARLEHATLSDI